VKSIAVYTILLLWSGGTACSFACEARQMLEPARCCSSSGTPCCDATYREAPAAPAQVGVQRPCSTLRIWLKIVLSSDIAIGDAPMDGILDGEDDVGPPPVVYFKNSLILAPPTP